METKRFDYAIGQALTNGSNAFLVAPRGSLLLIGDIVVTNRGNYRILFSDSYVMEDDILPTALRVALGHEPIKIQKRLTEQIFDWNEDESDDVVE